MEDHIEIIEGEDLEQKPAAERRAIYGVIDSIGVLMNIYISRKDHDRIDHLKLIKEQINIL